MVTILQGEPVHGVAPVWLRIPQIFFGPKCGCCTENVPGFMRFDTVTTIKSLDCSLIAELVTLRDNERHTSPLSRKGAVPRTNRPAGEQPRASWLGISLQVSSLPC